MEQVTDVSIVIVNYNTLHVLRPCIDSIEAHTKGINYEIIVVDNGSTDGSGKIATGFNDSRLIIHRLKENIGVSNARNKGVELSSSPYITFLDADDWWEPSFLEEMARLIEKHPSAGIYGSGYYIVKNGKKRVAPIGVDEEFTEGEINYCQVYAKTLCMPLTSISVCLPRAVFVETGGFPSAIKVGEDFLLWIQVASKFSTVFLNKPLCNYNQDVDPTYRATKQLPPPDKHMLWHLDDIEAIDEDHKKLIDSLRTYGLMPYLPSKIQRLYRKPIAYLIFRDWLQKLASRVKQKLAKTHSSS